MAIIKKVAIDQADKFVLSNKLWGTDAYEPTVYAHPRQGHVGCD